MDKNFAKEVFNLTFPYLEDQDYTSDALQVILKCIQQSPDLGTPDLVDRDMTSDPDEVRSFSNIMRGFDIKEKRFPEIDQCLRELGIFIEDT